MTEGGVSPVPREARPFQGRRAGVVTRGIANTIDGCIVVLVLLGCYLGLNALVFLADPRGFEWREAAPLKSITAAAILLIWYFTAAWGTTGRTYGDHVMGLRVVNYRGRKLSWPLSFLRAVACAIFPIGLLWCAASRARRSVQDVLLRTSVVYDWQPRHPGVLGSQDDPDPSTIT